MWLLWFLWVYATGVEIGLWGVDEVSGVYGGPGMYPFNWFFYIEGGQGPICRGNGKNVRNTWTYANEDVHAWRCVDVRMWDVNMCRCERERGRWICADVKVKICMSAYVWMREQPLWVLLEIYNPVAPKLYEWYHLLMLTSQNEYEGHEFIIWYSILIMNDHVLT